ncbi:DUF4232 domain-containing protein [Streptomyces sediminimaris]|uniref:DUF4232 domain-containing protein n=1 Tax=Streptomyces sediminimaris TaxID=3383721 RepID=UPI00399A6031
MPDHPRRHSRRARLGSVGALTVTALALLAACGDGASSASSGGTSTAVTTPTDTAGTTATATPTAGTTASSGHATGSPSAASSAGAAHCARDHLRLSLGRLSPAAGNLYAPLVFTNTGSSPCVLRGYPGVSLIDRSGHRIGRPAHREGPMRPSVELAPGAAAYAALHTVNKGVSDHPCWQPADRLQAYPPGSTWALRTDARSFRVCGDVFQVSAVRPGRHP